ncbi:MAG: GldG family protein [Treponema sp.]|nr:GldG family protein [Treponema sp.]
MSKGKKILAYIISEFLLYLLVIIFTFLCIIPINFFGDLDLGKIFTSFLCLLLFGSSIISLCIFINHIIESKIAALLLSIILLLIINCAHLISLYIPLGNLFSEILKKISFAWHFDAAGKGIIDSRDFIWLSASTVLFFLLTNFTLELKAENHDKNYHSLNIGLILLTFIVMLNSGRYYFRLDLSKNKTYSLAKYTKSLLKEIDQPVKITYYRSSSLNSLYPQIRDVSDFLKLYAEQNKEISLLIKDPDKDSSLAQKLQAYGIQSQQMRTSKNNSTEFLDVFSSIVIENQGDFKASSFILSADSLEYDLDSKIKDLIHKNNRIVNVIIGNGMNFTQDYSYLVPYLSLNGFTTNPIFINDPNFQEILDQTSGLLYVIGDSQIPIEKAIAIENYILSNRGNALFNVSPYSVDIEGDWSISQNQKTNIIEMLENWGIFFKEEIAADISSSQITMYSQEENQNPFEEAKNKSKILNYPLWINTMPQENCKLGATFFWASPIQINNENARAYILSSPAAYSYPVDKKSPKRLIESNPFMLENSDISNYPKESKILAVEITGQIQGLYNLLETNKEKIIVIPDQYFINTLMTGYNSMEVMDYRNFELITNLLLKLNGEEELAELQSRISEDTSLYKISDLESFLDKEIFTFIYECLLLPLLILVTNLLIFVIVKGHKK